MLLSAPYRKTRLDKVEYKLTAVKYMADTYCIIKYTNICTSVKLAGQRDNQEQVYGSFIYNLFFVFKPAAIIYFFI